MYGVDSVFYVQLFYNVVRRCNDNSGSMNCSFACIFNRNAELSRFQKI